MEEWPTVRILDTDTITDQATVLQFHCPNVITHAMVHHVEQASARYLFDFAGTVNEVVSRMLKNTTNLIQELQRKQQKLNALEAARSPVPGDPPMSLNLPFLSQTLRTWLQHRGLAQLDVLATT